MPTKAELEESLKACKAEIQELRNAKRILEQKAAKFEAKAAAAVEAEQAYKAKAAAAMEAEKGAKSIGTFSGPILAMSDTENLSSRWSTRTSAGCVVDIHGPNAERLARLATSVSETCHSLPDGDWRIKCSNRNAATLIAAKLAKRIKVEELPDTAVAKPSRGSATLAEDATRETGFAGVFALDGHPVLSVKGPVQVFVDGDSVILKKS